ncbi:type II toxin-antitoxin system RelE family toxin [Methanospirillum lacunae]|uniref:Type II toxin-antitoxin system RelE/ParE family toxin n=1 Tax=Methanospirillum lacunae TaxID=668570 RepID=A0A2V2N542_9EURY|nr:type II toxin-antitoxin system RelE/ParE family toxin [Methanospirillum lacunae]PWR72876.1 type II toxin-antitoxin system RelE/ParE family toxin [Methanospirillum lacunae]
MFTLVFSHSAEQGFKQIPKEYRLTIYQRLEDLCHLENPLLFLKKLKSPDGARRYSLRVGIFRVILKIEDDTMVIIVLDAGHRKHVYRKY